ncbi:MAG TPA: NAD+ synthase [bacterium]|nr:NAD+ synthase [bacterium]
MGSSVRFHLAQINPTVGAISANIEKILRYYRQAIEQNSQCVIFPELSIVGYPPQDLLYLNKFIADNMRALRIIAEQVAEIPAVIGFVDRYDEKLFSAAAVAANGEVQHIVHKRLLPTYDVFDEDRYFEEGEPALPVEVTINGSAVKLGIHICEDLWDAKSPVKVVDQLADQGADIFINLSASPFYVGKFLERLELARRKSVNFGKPFIYANQVGGQDELIYDGNSFVLNAWGELAGHGSAFEEALLSVDIDLSNGAAGTIEVPDFSREEEMFRALVLGVRDYCRKSGFESVVLGLSGGIDSSTVALIAANALQPENVYGISMPSRYSSGHSKSDAAALAENLGIHYHSIPIHDTYQAYLEMLRESFAGSQPDTTEENIQARIRGNILMAYSNKFNHLVLSTGNKTELALGYSTLYGDMSGGLAAISDVSKMEVYALCRWYNAAQGKPIVPESILTKTPSAELKEGQVDPFDYEVASPLVDEIIEHDRTIRELIDMGYDADLVRDIKQRIRRAEYKRRQAPPGLKVTRKSFGSGRRIPIINHYHEEDL